jgi:hypothetical protein
MGSSAAQRSTSTGENKGTFTWTSPQIGVYPLVFTATDGTHTVHRSLDLVVGDYGYPPENDGPMIYPAFPPPAPATVIHVSATGTVGGAGTETDPTTIREAQTRAMAAITPSNSVYVLLKRGDHWDGPSDFVLQDGLHGYKDAPVVFGAYGSGAMPKVARMVCWGSLEYLHWQDIEFTNVTLNGNSVYTIQGDYYSGNDRLRLHLKKRHRVQRLRFYQCEVNTGGVLRFCNSLANAAQGKQFPNSNMWWGGGPLAGMIRDIEIAQCTFRNAGKADAININSPDRGMWIHHNVFKDSKEDHVDIGTTIDASTFSIWTDLPVYNETINQDLSTMFVDPFDPAAQNTPLDLDNAGDWTRLDQVEK